MEQANKEVGKIRKITVATVAALGLLGLSSCEESGPAHHTIGVGCNPDSKVSIISSGTEGLAISGNVVLTCVNEGGEQFTPNTVEILSSPAAENTEIDSHGLSVVNVTTSNSNSRAEFQKDEGSHSATITFRPVGSFEEIATNQ